ncbi:MAG TPA: homoserine dehydrogenase, partial [Firmicutes bacterium]|nr:homoserine dehydrogenase [Bacillota bacterium]
MGKRTVKVGLLGLGTVGSGLVKILQMNGEQVTRRAGAKIEVKKILVRNIERQRAVEVDPQLLTTNPDDLLHDPDLDVIVETIGGIDRAHKYIEEALLHKKFVITANKDLMATAGDDLL